MTVFLDKNIYAPAGDYLAEHAEVVTDFEHPEKLDAIICRARPITRELIEQCPNLKVIARHSVGVDSVDVECATQRRIAVINDPTSNADSGAGGSAVFDAFPYAVRGQCEESGKQL